MEIFQIDCSAIGRGMLFPQHIEGRDWMGFHGTSSLYSPDIEARGFSQTKPIDANDIVLIADLMRRNGLDASDVEGFMELRSISFSPNSELCLAYCAPSMLGGQGMGFLKTAVDQLLSKAPVPLSSDESSKLNLVQSRLESIANAEAVIYAVDLQGLTRISYSNLTKAVHVYEAISPERLVAKLQIDKPVDFTSVDAKGLRQRLHNLYWSGQNHYIRRIPG